MAILEDLKHTKSNVGVATTAGRAAGLMTVGAVVAALVLRQAAARLWVVKAEWAEALGDAAKSARRLVPAWWGFGTLTIALSALAEACRRAPEGTLAGLAGPEGDALQPLLTLTQFSEDTRQLVEIVAIAVAARAALRSFVANVRRRIVGEEEEEAKEAKEGKGEPEGEGQEGGSKSQEGGGEGQEEKREEAAPPRKLTRASADQLRALETATLLLDRSVIAAAVLAALADYGVNVRPLLASLGASSIAIGFAAQGTLKNLIAAVALWSSQLFLPGDRVQLLGGGGSVAFEGTIESVQLWRTVIKTDKGEPLYISNAQVLAFAVKCVVGRTRSVAQRTRSVGGGAGNGRCLCDGDPLRCREQQAARFVAVRRSASRRPFVPIRLAQKPEPGRFVPGRGRSRGGCLVSLTPQEPPLRLPTPTLRFFPTTARCATRRPAPSLCLALLSTSRWRPCRSRSRRL